MVCSFNIPVETTNFSEIDDSLAHILRVRTDDRKQFFIWFIKFIFGVIEPETHTLRRSAEATQGSNKFRRGDELGNNESWLQRIVFIAIC